MLRASLFFLLATLLISQPTVARDAQGQRIGLVLSGGAARGLSHIGVIKALEEQGIEVDVVTGTSMGAIIGAMYASGYSVAQMAELGTGLNWGYALTDTPPRTSLTFRRKQDDRRHLLRTKLTVVNGEIRLPAGVIDGQNLDLVLQDIFRHTNDIQHFDQLPLPFRAVATDLETGQQVILAKGSLARAVRASMSIPGMLTPVHHEGLLLADGGMANNMPVDVARALGVDRVIAVDIGSPLSKADALSNVFAISNQVTTFLTIKNVQQQIAGLQPQDLLIQPDLQDLTSLDFSRAQEAIDYGYQATLALSEQLADFSSPSATARMPMALAKAPKITAISLANNSYLDDQALLSFIQQQVGQRFDRAQLDDNINTLYGLDYFNSVTYQLLAHRDGKRLHLIVDGDNRRKGFLRFGFNASDNFTGDSYYNIALAYNQTGISTYGAEWFSHIQLGNDILLNSEFYLPLRYKSPVYVQPKIGYMARDIPIYDNNLEQQTLQLRDKRVSAGLFVGYQFNQELDVSVGVGAAHGLLSREGGTLDFDNTNYQHGFGQLHLQLDSEDNVYFPSQGSRVDISLRRFDEALNAEASYYELEAYLSHAQTFGKNTLIARAQTVRTEGDNAIPSSTFLLGGLGRLSGLAENSLVTQNHELAALYYVRLLNSPLLVFDTRYYFIASLESGRSWNNEASRLPFNSGQITAGSLGVAMDSAVGPIILSYGMNSADRQAMYFSIGKSL